MAIPGFSFMSSAFPLPQSESFTPLALLMSPFSLVYLIVSPLNVNEWILCSSLSKEATEMAPSATPGSEMVELSMVGSFG